MTEAASRYASDLTGREWSMIEPFMPYQPRRGRRHKTSVRTVMDAIFYLLQSGCPGDGTSTGEIELMLGVACSTVQDNLKRAVAAGLRWPLFSDFTDDAIEDQAVRAPVSNWVYGGGRNPVGRTWSRKRRMNEAAAGSVLLLTIRPALSKALEEIASGILAKCFIKYHQCGTA
nr:transposase [Marinicella sp. W31]MDC2877542.1 transposase [Marinicella sp. W31]